MRAVHHRRADRNGRFTNASTRLLDQGYGPRGDNGGDPHRSRDAADAAVAGGTVGLAPLGHQLPAEFVVVPLTDMAPSRVVAVWNEGNTNPADPILHRDRDSRLPSLSAGNPVLLYQRDGEEPLRTAGLDLNRSGFQRPRQPCTVVVLGALSAWGDACSNIWRRCCES
ncbi:hypothetical protein GCM10009663_59260 [Kitasatospora arboriphila]|uniref:Uncharacterized protein n=1 Tax=Kitasatospora arboriphila TaxID=258052 RepID=A0ABP4EKQ0_9ACTN